MLLDIPYGMKYFFEAYLFIVFLSASAGMYHTHFMAPATQCIASVLPAYDVSFNSP
jgi:hypothetical protein